MKFVEADENQHKAEEFLDKVETEWYLYGVAVIQVTAYRKHHTVKEETT